MGETPTAVEASYMNTISDTHCRVNSETKDGLMTCKCFTALIR